MGQLPGHSRGTALSGLLPGTWQHAWRPQLFLSPVWRARLHLLARRPGTPRGRTEQPPSSWQGWGVGGGNGRRQTAERRTRQWSTACQSPPVRSRSSDVLLQRAQPLTSLCPSFCLAYLVSNSQVKNRLSELGVRPTVHPPRQSGLRDFFSGKVAHPHRPHWLAPLGCPRVGLQPCIMGICPAPGTQ